ncbi:endonuclease/exonuclease/phosphatase family protein [Terracoccus luteus]|uniref:Vancomycin resistance protein VanJ n=1 Tax=Terracoccus luteus TaxID=53356 RepID=A0A839PTC3_9MICO|nr:endonuclease/exonuclease/phosphatase family protein [Terracoccus luteus]MBB2985246.1 vancomycin resistance protein VanJ [Terracoccus luteus]MCP2170898.1 vancomycin resistance protein VanJ [Terracoccus luteus]
MPGAPGEAPRAVRAARAIAVAAGLLTLVLVGHRLLPGELGFLVETALVWLGMLVLPLLAWAAVARSRGGATVALVPAVVWALLFVPAVVPLTWTAADPVTGRQLVVASQNVAAGARTAGDSASSLVAGGAQVIGLQELTASARRDAADVLRESHPHSYTVGTVGLWSAYPIENARPLELRLGWRRALRADVVTPSGTVRVYVVHAASARVGAHGERDAMLEALARVVAADDSERIVLVGDLNAVSTDRALSGLHDELDEPNLGSGGVLRTWPTTLPLLGLDHVMGRGVEFTDRESLVVGEGDHLATRTTLNL